MKKIDELAHDVCKNYSNPGMGYYANCHMGFTAGFKSAFEWIKADLFSPKELTDVLVILSDGRVTIGCLRDSVWGYSGFRSEDIKVLSWRYIDLEDYNNHFKLNRKE